MNKYRKKFPLWRGLGGGLLFLLLITISTSVSAQKDPIAVEKRYKIEIQTSAICEMCKHTLERDMAFEKGVKESSLNLDNKVISVTYNPRKTDGQTIRKRIAMIGYHADTLARDSIAYENLPKCCKDGAHGTPIPQLPLKGR